MTFLTVHTNAYYCALTEKERKSRLCVTLKLYQTNLQVKFDHNYANDSSE